jgi:UPF0755 protein
MSKKYFIVIGFIALFLAVLLGRPAGGPPQRFIVSKGESVRAISRQLASKGVIRTPFIFRGIAKVFDVSIKPGAYTFSGRQTGWEILRQLHRGPETVRVTVPEGWTSAQIAAALETHGVVAAKDFQAAVKQSNSEGMLFPDTYFFEQGIPAEEVIRIMRKRYDEEKPKDLVDQCHKLHLSERQILILASLVEREARAPSERPVIAGVFYNRLKKHWRLESCATVQYAMENPKAHLTYKDLDIDSPYNTYRHPGLPPGPISNPGAASLDAATHPADTDMMFFVANGQGTHRFSRYYSEHLAAQKGKKKRT